MFDFVKKETWAQFIGKLEEMFAAKADKTEIPTVPDTLPNTYPVTFGGIMPQVSYDGSKAVTVNLPSAEIMNESMGTPVGEIIAYMGNTPPTNYLACDGTVYNITDYPELSQHFADEFGAVNHFGGDGTVTFAVPDLRGEFLRGTGTNSHENSGNGAEVGVHQNATKHVRVGGSSSQAMVFPLSSSTDFYSDNNDSQVNAVNRRQWVKSTNSDSLACHSHYTSRPTNTSILWCIKCRPTYFVNVPSHVYSLEERRVGYWIDGKPLYEKTIDFGDLPNKDTKTVSHGVKNVDAIWVYDGYALNIYGSYLQLVWPGSNFRGNAYLFYASKGAIGVQTVGDESDKVAFIVLRYTKTTD